MTRRIPLFLVTLFVVTSARANDRGFELMLRPGYGSAGRSSPVVYEPTGMARVVDSQVGTIYGQSASPYGGGFLGDAYVGYRFLPFLSAGLTGGFRTATASAVADGSTNVARSSWRTGVYARAYLPLLPKLAPWASVGVGYVSDTQTFTRGFTAMGTMVNVDYNLQHHGVGLPFAVGIDFQLLPMLAVGPSFEYAFVAPAGGCLKTSGTNIVGQSFCSDADPQTRVTAVKSYGVWSVGLDLRLTL